MIASSRMSKFPRTCAEGQPVGQVVLDESINAVVDQLFELLPNSEFADDMKQLVKNAWQPGRGYVNKPRP